MQQHKPNLRAAVLARDVRAHMLTVSAIALAIAGWSFAAAAAEQKQEETGAQQQAAAQPSQQQTGSEDKMKVEDPVDLTTWAHAPLYEGVSVEDLLDADVTGPEGDEFGEVENVIIDPGGEVAAMVVEAGGFLDIGDTHFRIPWNEVEISADADDVTIPVTEDNVEDYALFEGEYVPKELREWQATELIGDYATLESGIGYGYVDDLIIGRDGKLEAVVVMPDYTYGLYAPYAYPYYGYAYGWAPGLPYYGLPYAEADIEALEPFDYEKMDGASAQTEDTAEADTTKADKAN